MNEQLKKFAERAGLFWQFSPAYENCLNYFAELVRDDERDKCAADYLQDCCDAVDAARLEEREAIAKICDASTNLDWLAKEIRARGVK